MAWKDNIIQMTTKTTNLADNFNAIHNDLLDNDKYLKQIVDEHNAEISNLKTTKLNSATFTTFKNEQKVIDDKQAKDITDLQSKVENKNKVDGVGGQNLDFIRRDVVQDGLVDLSIPIQDGLEFFCSFTIMLSDVSSAKSLVLRTAGTEGWMFIASSHFRLATYNAGVLTSKDSIIKVVKDTPYEITIKSVENNITITINGQVAFSNIRFDSNKSIVTNIQAMVLKYLQYNRTLTPEEIQHNFQVLNNSPSIGSINVTDSTGTSKKFLLSSDSEHVITRTGHNVEEAYTGILKTMAKEFTSVDGAPINIPNGVEYGKVLSAMIKGQTVKNCILNRVHTPRLEYTSDNYAIIPSDPGLTYEIMGKLPDYTKEYTLVFFIRGNTKTSDAYANASVGTSVFYDVKIPAGYNGVLISNQTPKVGSDKYNRLIGHFICENLQIASMILEGKYTKEQVEALIKSPLQVGLSSTEAIIDNNGLKYSFYLGDGTPIMCGSVGGVYDTFEIKEDGSGVYTRRLEEDVIDGSRSFSYFNLTFDKTIRAYTEIPNAPIATDGLIIGDTLNKVLYTDDQQGIIRGQSNAGLYIRLNRTELESFDEAGYKKYFTKYPCKIIYPAATPIVTVIPKELIPTIAINQTNICKVDSSVAPSEFTIVAPTTDGIRKEYPLTLLNSYTGSAKANLLQTGEIELDINVTVPSTFNQSITSLPTELRPSVARSIVAMNGNTPIVLTVNTDGSVKCPTTVTGAISCKQKYTK